MNAAGHIRSGMASPTKVQAYAGRTLDLLQAIEKTIDYLTENRDHMAVLASGVVKTLEELHRARIEVVLDPEGRVCELFARCLEAIERMHQNSTVRRESAVNDCRLHVEDGVVEAYDAFLASLSDAYAVLHELKEWIHTHDSLLEPSLEGTFDSVDDLIGAIRSKA